jgi:hypothetical protein
VVALIVRGEPRFELGNERAGVGRGQHPEAPHTLKPPDLALDPAHPLRLPLGSAHAEASRARRHSGQSHRHAATNAGSP